MDDFRELLGKVDRYVEELFATNDEVLEQTLLDSREAGLPEIQVSPNQGKLLRMLAEMVGARRILEIGTLGGYSAAHFARALSNNGTLISLEVDEQHAEVARKNIERAGLGDRVEVLAGDAHELLSEMVESGIEPFDLDFYRRGERRLPSVPGAGAGTLATRLPDPGGQHDPGRQRAGTGGRIRPRHTRVQRKNCQTSPALGDHLAPNS